MPTPESLPARSLCRVSELRYPDENTLSDIGFQKSNLVCRVLFFKKTKNAKHGKIHNDNLIPFWPLVLESNGAMHSYLRHLIFFAADHADKDKPPDANWSTPSFKIYWTARISCANRFATAGKINKAVSKLSCSEHNIPGFGIDFNDNRSFQNNFFS